MTKKWTCRCGGFSCSFTFTGTASQWPVQIGAPCCGDEFTIEFDHDDPPRQHRHLSAV